MATATREAAQAPPVPNRRATGRRAPWPVELYRSAVGKKYVMAVTGIALMGFVLAHMIGNLKIYLGAAEFNEYGEFLRELLVPIAPHHVVLWIMRVGLIVAFGLHIHAAYSLTRLNWASREVGYQSKRDYIAANYASRTMRWSGIIVGLYIVFHLFDLSWTGTGARYVRGDVYGNVTASLERPWVAAIYIAANLALGLHLYHGSWSLFQTMGWNNPRFNRWRRGFATGFAAVVTLGNISFPVLILAGAVNP